jgi:molybdenum cofactor cytidylyltransferase
MPPLPFQLGAVILAAGASSRMGRPKLLLPWGNTSVLGHLITKWMPLAAQVAVVCAPDDHALGAELDRLSFARSNRIVNPTPEEGMFSSIQAAARWDRWNGALTHWAISLGDQPHVRFESLAQLVLFASQHPEAISQPERNGRARHPVILPQSAWRGLASSSHEHLKQFLETTPLPRAFSGLDDPGLDLDLDHPRDYEEALIKYGPSS